MKDAFKNHLSSYVLQANFPCIMAKAVANKGLFRSYTIEQSDTHSPIVALKNLYEFVNDMQKENKKLASCALVFEDEALLDFDTFEKFFWGFLKDLNTLDKAVYPPDPNVSSDPSDGSFSYSIKTESFFIIVLHPKSPRWSRRFTHPTIVFNPHKQFEEMRANGTYLKVRDLIRMKDKLLQGETNPMLQNFGEKTEVFQYLGKAYDAKAPVPLHF